MKKHFTLLCLLCILFMLTGAAAAPGDAHLFTEAQREALGIDAYGMPTMAVVGDTIYTLWGPDVYAWQPGMDVPEQVASNLLTGYYSNMDEALASEGDDAKKLTHLLVSDGQTVWGLNKLSGHLYPLTFSEGLAVYGTPVALDWADIDDVYNSNEYTDLFSVCYNDGFLYMLMRNDTNYDNPMLFAFDLSTGEAQQLDIEYVQAITAYKDGKLLLEIFDQQAAFNRDTGEMSNPTVAIYDPADGSVTEAGTFGDYNMSGIAYDKQNDTLYYTTNSQLMAMPSLGEPTQVAFMPVDYASDAPAAVLPGGLYAIDVWSGLIVRNTDPAFMPDMALSVYGGNLDNAATAFMAEHPDVPLNFNQDVYFQTPAALAQAMVSGDNTFDVYFYDLSYQDFASLMEKGYCLDLSPYTDITDQLSSMYPFIQDAISDNGAFYAVPAYMYSSGLCRFEKAWEDTDLLDRIPTTFMELMDFIQWWADEGMIEYPDTQLMEYAYDYGTTLFQMVFEQYVETLQAKGEDITLNTPLFREMFSALEAVDIEALNDSIPPQEDNDMISYEEYIAGSLLSTYGEVLQVYAYEDYTTPLVLPIQEGDPIYVPVNISCVFINPNTQNREMAVEYLRAVLSNMQPMQHIMMFPDDNEPVANKYYQEMKAEQEEMLLKAQASLETAAPEDVKGIEAAIADYQASLSEMEQYYWDASAESIAAYRELAQYAFAVTPTMLSYSGNDDAYSEIQNLVSRYLQKQMTMEQFITQMDQKLRMMRLERE